MAVALTPPVHDGDHALGPGNAPVTLVEYGDYQCPSCGLAFQVLDIVLRELHDSVRFVFRNFPLAVHEDAELAAQAAEAVAAQAGEEAFWKMHAILFENQDALSPDDLLGYAEASGADPLAIADDLSSGRIVARVRGDIESGIRSGVGGTPTFFVNGRRFEGDWADADAFTAALMEAAQSPTRH